MSTFTACRSSHWYLLRVVRHARFSSDFARSATRSAVTVSLPVGGSGSIDIKIYEAIHSSQPDINKVLIHLRPRASPIFTSARETSSWQQSSALAHQYPDTTIIELSYRLSTRPEHEGSQNDHRFPIPIHDVSTAWDYILEQVARPATQDDGSQQVPQQTRPTRITLCGSHIGGGLALTLALVHPTMIHAVAVQDPIVDWPGLDRLAAWKSSADCETTRTSKKEKERERVANAAKQLVNLRTQLFRTPSAYFDEFASPVLFLRAPGRDTPLTRTAAVSADSDEYTVDGTKMSYGREDGGFGDAEAEQYGPYDDDWHAAERGQLRRQYYDGRGMAVFDAGRQVASQKHGGDVDDAAEELASRLGSLAFKDETPKRRKVLRKWPSYGQPESVDLPFINIFVSPEPVDTQMLTTISVDSVTNSQTAQDLDTAYDISPVTRLQSIEMVDLMKRACFWGRGKGLADERVFLSSHESGHSSDGHAKAMTDWLMSKMDAVDTDQILPSRMNDGVKQQDHGM